MAMRMRGALVLVCALAGAATADNKAADRLFSEGRAALAANNPAEACEKFEAAIKIDATATGTMLNLGLCYEKLRKYATSLDWFRKAQTAAAENHLSDYEKAAKDHTIALRDLVNTLQITVEGASQADVLVGGRQVRPTDYGRYEVDAGTLEIVARAPGKKPFTQTLEVPERTKNEANPPIEIQIDLTEDAVPVFIDRGAGRRKAALFIGAGGIAALAFTGVYGIVQKGKFDDAAGDPTQQKRIKDQVRYVGTGVFIVGAGLVGAAAFLYFTADGKEQVSDGTAFAPVITNDQLGLAVSGRF